MRRKKMPMTMYTVSKIRKTSDKLYGPIHLSDYAEKTLCGKKIGYGWYIVNNTFDGKATCKECLQVQKEKEIGR
jgi:hypothetical protein